MSLATTWKRYVDMETTLSYSNSNSSCSASVGVIRPLMKTVLFSLRMAGIKMRGPGNKPSRTTSQDQGGDFLTDGRGKLNYGGSMRYTLILLLAGCATTIPQGEKYFSIQHGTLMFGSAMGQARRHCEEMGMTVRHLGTDQTGFQPVSRFECVPK